MASKKIRRSQWKGKLQGNSCKSFVRAKQCKNILHFLDHVCLYWILTMNIELFQFLEIYGNSQNYHTHIKSNVSKSVYW